MVVRFASLKDLSTIESIYKNAQRFMKKHNNPHQWGDFWPPKEFLIESINNKILYVLVENKDIAGVFSLALNGDSDFENIYAGKWLNNKPYICIHSVASSFKYKNVLHNIVKFASTFKKDLRIDTHPDNKIMQKAVIKEGFVYCGLVNIEVAKQKNHPAYQLIVN